MHVADALTWAYRTIHARALEWVGDMRVDQAAPEVFSAAWSILDNLDTARQVLATLWGGKKGSNTHALFAALENVRKLRNWRDHLDQRMQAILRSSGKRAPVFGVLSYCYVASDECTVVGGQVVVSRARIITVCAGASSPGEELPMVNPVGKPFYPPIDHLLLSAFDVRLELGALVGLYADFIRHQDVQLEVSLAAKLSAHAEASGTPIEQLWQHHPSYLALSADITFGEKPAD